MKIYSPDKKSVISLNPCESSPVLLSSVALWQYRIHMPIIILMSPTCLYMYDM